MVSSKNGPSSGSGLSKRARTWSAPATSRPSSVSSRPPARTAGSGNWSEPSIDHLPNADLIVLNDVSNPAKPKELAKWKTAGKGVHRYSFDGRYAYISPEMDGYVGNIAMILDLKDPARPEEVGRWWMPGTCATDNVAPPPRRLETSMEPPCWVTIL